MKTVTVQTQVEVDLYDILGELDYGEKSDLLREYYGYDEVEEWLVDQHEFNRVEFALAQIPEFRKVLLLPEIQYVPLPGGRTSSVVVLGETIGHITEGVNQTSASVTIAGVTTHMDFVTPEDARRVIAALLQSEYVASVRKIAFPEPVCAPLPDGS